MNLLDFMLLSLYLLVTLLPSFVHGGLPDVLPPERCYLFHIDASVLYHKENKRPTMDNLKRIIPALTKPYDLPDYPQLRCNETTVTLANVKYSSNPDLNETKITVLFKVEPNKNVPKIWGFHCAENLLHQGTVKVHTVEQFLRFREDDNNNPVPNYYTVNYKACCVEQYSYHEPCCRAGYTLVNTMCVRNEIEEENEKGELAKMEKEAGDNCEPTGPKLSVGIIIIIASGSFILFVSIVLAGVRFIKYKHRPNRSGYNDVRAVPEAVTTEVQPEERRTTGESSVPTVAVAVLVEEETKDGYIPMKNLSRTKLLDATQNTAEDTNQQATTANDQESRANPSDRKRPLSRQFSFDKHIPLQAIDFTNKMLGRGQFGQVELAYVTIHGLRQKCAVKMIRGRGTLEDERELFEELQMLYQIPHHPNVVSLLGACLDENSPLFVVVEYCANGSLLKYLQNSRTNSYEYVNYSSTRIDFRWKLNRAIEICNGMIFLAKKQVIHRDLAARNILLDEHEVAKISDFGMAKDVYLRGLYIKETAGFLPVRWMAIEAIESRIYTIKSDMWSFGILLWEMYMDGINPYPGVADSNDLLEKYLKKGYRMAQPENCPDSFYHLMERCWLEKPEDRPSFVQALRDLEVLQDEEMRRESEASKVTEVSFASDLSVEDDPFRDTSDSTHTPTKDAPPSEENAMTMLTPQGKTEDDAAKSGNPMDIGIVNRGRSSIDSGTDVKLPRTLRKNSDEQTSHF